MTESNRKQLNSVEIKFVKTEDGKNLIRSINEEKN